MNVPASLCLPRFGFPSISSFRVSVRSCRAVRLALVEHKRIIRSLNFPNSEERRVSFKRITRQLQVPRAVTWGKCITHTVRPAVCPSLDVPADPGSGAADQAAPALVSHLAGTGERPTEEVAHSRGENSTRPARQDLPRAARARRLADTYEPLAGECRQGLCPAVRSHPFYDLWCACDQSFEEVRKEIEAAIKAVNNATDKPFFWLPKQ